MYMYVYMYVCMYVCIYVYICIYDVEDLSNFKRLRRDSRVDFERLRELIKCCTCFLCSSQGDDWEGVIGKAAEASNIRPLVGA